MKWILTTVFLVVTASSGHAEYLEILYVNANTGAAAGGHVALRLGNDVFHYQFYPDDRFLLVRESWDAFQLVYNRLRNRTISGVICPVSAETFTTIRNHFSTLLASQRRDFSNLFHLFAQKATLAGGASGVLDINVQGAGFFTATAEKSPGGKQFRAKLFARVEESHLTSRRAMVVSQLDKGLETVGKLHHSGNELLSKIQEIIDLEKKRVAYDIILDGKSLLDSTLVAGMDDKLTPRMRDNLTRYLERRLEVLAHLLVSHRRDTGEAIIIETARCQTILESLARGRLVTLDPYPEGISPRQLDPQDQELRRYLSALSAMLLEQCYQLLDAAAGETGAEMDYRYLQIENVHGRLAEIVAAGRDGRGIRISPAMMLPSHPRIVQTRVPALNADQLDSASLLVEQDLAFLSERIKKKYRYALIERNCVNELLRSLNGSFSDRAGTETALGAWIDPVTDRVVIPYDFFYQVSTRYHLTNINRYPSRRVAQVETMKKQSDPVEVWFREGNTLSSTLYRHRTEDTPFLFFTDDVSWTRPILGCANLIWSAAHGFAGTVALPVKGGNALRQAARGMFYSVPELFFFNIRKGTYLYDVITPGGHEL